MVDYNPARAFCKKAILAIIRTAEPYALAFAGPTRVPAQTREAVLEYWVLLVLSALFNAMGALMVKLVLNRQGPFPLFPARQAMRYIRGLLGRPLMWLGVGSILLATPLFATTLSHLEVLVAFPAFMGMNLALLMVFSMALLKERPTGRKIWAFLFTCLGVILLRLG